MIASAPADPRSQTEQPGESDIRHALISGAEQAKSKLSEVWLADAESLRVI